MYTELSGRSGFEVLRTLRCHYLWICLLDHGCRFDVVILIITSSHMCVIVASSSLLHRSNRTLQRTSLETLDAGIFADLASIEVM